MYSITKHPTPPLQVKGYYMGYYKVYHNGLV